MPVSANTLFHFTTEPTLLKILSSQGFWPKYSLERFHKALPRSSNYIKTYIPMVCFCDLKLTQLSDTSISNHTKFFGNFGIGFHKSWGIKNNVSPVVYIHQNSVASTTVVDIISTVNNLSIANKSNLTANLGNMVKFLKPYTGFYQKGKRRNREINYYDEREWRFIPRGKRFGAFPEKTTPMHYLNTLNNELQKRPLKFTYKDIKYIVIENDSNKQSVVNIIESLNISKNAKSDLITKIITMQEIKEDF